jgi:hypothetical protein
MTLYDATKRYLVYIQALRLPRNTAAAYKDAMRSVLWFYGSQKSLDAFDDSTAMQYIKVFDPFDCDPAHERQGGIYCQFIYWLMMNKMIPAWAHAGSLNDMVESNLDGFDRPIL